MAAPARADVASESFERRNELARASEERGNS